MAILVTRESKGSRALWQFPRKRIEMPTAVTALPGRSEPAFNVSTKHFVSGNRIQPPFPAGLEKIMVSMGCFWGAERKFWQAPGVHATAVGYAAGLTPNPTCEEVCSGHTEHNEVVVAWFDPKKTSYEAMLRVFWVNHYPTQGMRQGNGGATITSSPWGASAASVSKGGQPVPCLRPILRDATLRVAPQDEVIVVTPVGLSMSLHARRCRRVAELPIEHRDLLPERHAERALVALVEP